MGITQQIGASSLIKPGVIDNTAARPASPYEGQVIFQKDTDQLLVWNGTAWVIPNSPAQNPMGLELISTVAIGSGVTSFDIGTFSSTYDAYKLVVTNIASSVSDTLMWQFLSGSTPNGASNYIGGYIIASTSTSAISASVGTRDRHYMTGTTSTSFKHNGFCDILSPYLADYTYVSGTSYTGRTDIVGFGWNTIHTVASSYTGIRCFMNSGTTMTGGTASMYGYRK